MGQIQLEVSAILRLFEKLADGVLVIDNSWNIVFANSQARTYLNIPASAERVSEDLIPKLSNQFVLSTELIDLAIDDEQSVAFEASNRPELSFDMVLSIYMSRSTKDGLRFLIIRDVTEEQREEFLKRSFLSLISHKLLTPITVTKAALENMKAGVLGQTTDKQDGALGKCLERMNRLSRMVNRLSEYTQLLGQQPGARLPLIDALKTARDFCEEFCSRPIAKGIELRVEAAECDATVAARESQLSAVFENLFDNSIKFSSGERVNISVRGERIAGSGEFCLTVRDDGPGIPPSVKANVFKEFAQRDDDFTGNTEGLGLGLPMVKNIMNLFGGRVEIDSTTGSGTSVMLFFPPV
ncbi:MAG TPA: ATP-binding protein [bacterium]|nr:ATP-binding protein [bacterium]